MKKIILFVALVSICAISFGQLTDKEVVFENNSFSQVFETTVPPATQYLNAKQWIAKTFGSYKAVVQFEDESAHKIILKGQVIAPNDGIITETTWYQDKVTYSFTMTIDIKNGKYRVKIEDVTASVETKAVPKDNPMATPSLSNNVMTLEEYINWDKRSSEYAFLREMHFKQKIVPMLNSLVKDINIVDDF